jgi:hypothetical protein
MPHEVVVRAIGTFCGAIFRHPWSNVAVRADATFAAGETAPIGATAVQRPPIQAISGETATVLDSTWNCQVVAAAYGRADGQ